MANKLRPEVAAKYTCTIEPKPVRLRPPVADYTVDLRTISLEEADELVARGLDLLVLNGAAPKADHRMQSGIRKRSR